MTFISQVHSVRRRRESTAGWAVAAIGLIALSRPAESGDFGFLSPIAYLNGPNSEFVQLADVNEDGHPDIVTTSAADGTVWVRLGAGGSAFGASAVLTAQAGAAGFDIAYLNADSHLDIAVINTTAESISIFMGTGDGSFASAINYASVGSMPRDLTAADFDGDGDRDIAITRQVAQDVIIYRNEGTATGSFPNVMNALPALPGQVVRILAGDLDGDLDQDFAVTCDRASGDEVYVYTNNGSGAFGSTAFTTADEARGLFMADVNEDAAVDLCVTEVSTDSVKIFFGPTLTSSASLPVGDAPYGLWVADFDIPVGIHHLDVVTGNRGSDNISVALGDGMGGFSAATSFPAADGTMAIAAADLDADEDLDLVTTDNIAGTVSVLLNTRDSGVPGWESY